LENIKLNKNFICFGGKKFMAEKLKIGIIGCGGIANGKHMPSLKNIPNVEMVAFCDLEEDKAKKAAKPTVYIIIIGLTAAIWVTTIPKQKPPKPLSKPT